MMLVLGAMPAVPLPSHSYWQKAVSEQGMNPEENLRDKRNLILDALEKMTREEMMTGFGR